MKQGFTLLELLVVISVIVALCGLAYPVYTSIQRNAQIKSTKNLCYAVTAACTVYGHEFFTGTDGQLWHSWMLGQKDLNNVPVTTEIDGDPRLYPTGDPSPLAQRAPASYTGFINMTGFPVPWRPNSKGQLIDRWGQPLNMDYNVRKYGGDGVGVWSNGPDHANQNGAIGSDDITSWLGNGDQ